MEIKLTGKSVVAGYAKGTTFLYQKEITDVPCYNISEDQIADEWERFQVALSDTKTQLLQLRNSTLKTFGASEAEIFDIQLALLEDTHVLEQIRLSLSEKKKNIEFCFISFVNTCLEQFKEHEISSIRDRYLDFDDVGTRLLKILLKSSTCHLLESNLQGKILLAKNLTPSNVLFLKDKGLQGIILEEKCTVSHSVILAKSLNIPIIVGIDNLINSIEDNSAIEINGETGEVWINSRINHLPEPIKEPFMPFNNPLGVKFYLSYDSSTSLEQLQNVAISGIGLLRSEILFLSSDTFPSEEEQFEYYKEAILKANEKVVILRTLDIGGDKNINRKPNSPLGLRGIRWSLKNIFAFKVQLRAMLRASAFGNIKLLFPMISSEQELIQANKVLEACKQDLAVANIPFAKTIEVGAMIETPSALLILDLLAKHCSFFSIGTNDLIQYLLAVDRTDNQVADLYDWQHPAILRALQIIVEKAEKLNIPVYMCGELPNNTEAFSFCLGLGFRKFTISLDRLTSYQKLVNEIDISQIQENSFNRLKNLDK